MPSGMVPSSRYSESSSEMDETRTMTHGPYHPRLSLVCRVGSLSGRHLFLIVVETGKSEVKFQAGVLVLHNHLFTVSSQGGDRASSPLSLLVTA